VAAHRPSLGAIDLCREIGQNARAMRRPALLPWLLAFAGLLLTLSFSQSAHAYGWMIKHGYAKCLSCHTDPSGGETLTRMGRVQAERLLSFGGRDQVELRPRTGFLFGVIGEPDDVYLGGSYRHMGIYTAADGDAPSDFTHFPMQLDLYGSANLGRFVIGAGFGYAQGIEGTANARGAQLNDEEGDGSLLLSRTHYVGLRLDPSTLLRLGRLNLPFGVRIPEHVMWARESTRTDRESDQQHGAAIAYSKGRTRFEGMVVFGNFQVNPDQFRERGLVASGEYLTSPTSALGTSLLVTRAARDRLLQIEDMVRQAYAVHGRFGFGSKMSLLAEADLLKETSRGLGYTGFAQFDYEALRGLHLVATAEILDGGKRDARPAAPGSGELRTGLWGGIQWFGFSHFDVRLDAVSRQDEALSLQGQLHLYL
jgi:hypothetical protein